MSERTYSARRNGRPHRILGTVNRETAYTPDWIANRLRSLRIQLVLGHAADKLQGHLSYEQAALLADFCRLLCLDDRQVKWVFGNEYQRLVDAGTNGEPNAL